MGETVISCHGISLPPLEAENVDEVHDVRVDAAEDEYIVTVDHEMTKNHYISFVAVLSSDRLQFVKLYPEGTAQARFKLNGVKTVLYNGVLNYTQYTERYKEDGMDYFIAVLAVTFIGATVCGFIVLSFLLI
ncbi:MAG: hypothetical protein QM697_03320 [Lachnospiraceae bacterium]